MNAVGAYSATLARRDNDLLVLRHAELVKRIAYHLAGRLPPTVEVEDLIQAGMIGLIEAAAHYSSERGASFETYAGIRIRGAMLDALRQLDWTPRSVHRRARDAAAAIREIEAEHQREARDAEVAERLGLPIEEYHRLMHDAASCHVASLEEIPAAQDVADRSADPLGETQQAAFRGALAAAIEGLPARERLVMSLYYDQELNLKEIGAVLKVTESRVCQLHGQALVRLRARLGEWLGKD
ncbi:MAG: flagellar biosynthesis sigma factor [Pseudomonadota bacterium]